MHKQAVVNKKTYSSIFTSTVGVTANECRMHCMQHSLSDPKKKDFKMEKVKEKECKKQHSHDKVCERCKASSKINFWRQREPSIKITFQSIYYPLRLINQALTTNPLVAQMEEKQLRLLRFDFATAQDDIARWLHFTASWGRVACVQTSNKFLVYDQGGTPIWSARSPRRRHSTRLLHKQLLGTPWSSETMVPIQ